MAKPTSDNQFHLDVLGKAYKIWTQFCDDANTVVCTFEEFLEGWRFHEPNVVSGRAGDDTISIFWRPDGPVVQIADTLEVRHWRPSAKAEKEADEKLDLFGLMRRLLDEIQKQNVQFSLMSERIDNMALDFTNFDTALASVAADAKQASVDSAAILAVISGASGSTAADQAKIDAATTALTAVKAQQDATNTALEAVIPAAPAPVVSAPVAAALAAAPSA